MREVVSKPRAALLVVEGVLGQIDEVMMLWRELVMDSDLSVVLTLALFQKVLMIHLVLVALLV